MIIEEHNPQPANPIGLDGIEFVEYATAQPQAFGALLQQMGFAAVGRHRSREVVLYRQGTMKVIVNAHAVADPVPSLAAIAFRVRDAGEAFRRCLDLGAWEMPTRAAAMELHIPGIHGAGDSLIYFVDRYRDFSIYDVDFIPLGGIASDPPAIAGLHWFGVVQAMVEDRTRDWLDFYETLFGFTELPHGHYFGVLPKGVLLQSPCRKFYLQLIGPPAGAEDMHWEEGLVRVGLGAPDVLAATSALARRGIAFIDRGAVQPSERGALTQVYLGGVTFELVVSHLRP